MNMYKVTIDNDSEHPVFYKQEYSSITLTPNMVKIERINLMDVDYTSATGYQSDVKALMIACFALAKYGLKIDAIQFMRATKRLHDDGLLNCKYIVDNMEMFDNVNDFLTLSGLD